MHSFCALADIRKPRGSIQGFKHVVTQLNPPHQIRQTMENGGLLSSLDITCNFDGGVRPPPLTEQCTLGKLT